MVHFCRQIDRKISAILPETYADTPSEVFPGSQQMVTRTRPTPVFVPMASRYLRRACSANSFNRTTHEQIDRTKRVGRGFRSVTKTVHTPLPFRPMRYFLAD